MELIKNKSLNGAEGKSILFDLHFKPNQVKKSVVIYVHGFNGFKDWGQFDLIANHFALHDYFFIKLNLSHNGTTALEPESFVDLDTYSLNNYTKELTDVKNMIDWVCDVENPYSHELNTESVVLLGHSRGGGISILQASEDIRVKALITWAAVGECKTPWGQWSKQRMDEWQAKGITYIENKRTHQQMPLRYQLVEDYQLHAQRLNIQKAFQQLHIPVQVCHGTDDEAVPYSVFLQFKKWNPQADFVSVKSNHVFDRKHPNTDGIIPPVCMEVIEQNIAFLKKNGI